MKKVQRIALIMLSGFVVNSFVLPSHAADRFPLFDIDQRREELTRPEFKDIREGCMAINEKMPDRELEPRNSLVATQGYGTDNGMNNFAWAMILQGGRALAGDKKADEAARKLLLDWANAKALEETPEHYDPYYALKRGLLPTITTFAIVRPQMSKDEQETVKAWLDGLVRRVDATFDGDVDENNHRYLADSVLMLWGGYIGDKRLYKKGVERFEAALADMQADGALPLEDRRGARALWYLRQSLADFTLMAEVGRNKGDDLYALEKNDRSLALLMNHFLNGVQNQGVMLERASENYIPGPSNDFLNPDMGFLDNRGRRHLLAFGEAYRLHAQNEFSRARLETLMLREVDEERPLMDDYIGGNATCFWARP
ncbi:MAG: alginate lyase family protein [Rhodospirillales bacterium]|nr:alginate lyase family protein [Rhodospirillales bacterium]